MLPMSMSPCSFGFGKVEAWLSMIARASCATTRNHSASSSSLLSAAISSGVTYCTPSTRCAWTVHTGRHESERFGPRHMRVGISPGGEAPLPTPSRLRRQIRHRPQMRSPLWVVGTFPSSSGLARHRRVRYVPSRRIRSDPRTRSDREIAWPARPTIVPGRRQRKQQSTERERKQEPVRVYEAEHL